MTIAKNNVILSKKENKYDAVKMSFFIAAIVSAAIFLPYLIIDKGFFLYCGDYNEQQIPFYQYVNGFLKSADGGTWSWATDLGSSVVAGYAFYNLGSPFLWLSLVVPARFMPFAMVPLFILKFAGIAAASALFLQRYAKTSKMVVVCSLIYTFCGFNIYNIFFNHMLDPVVIFPLLLWSLDEFMYVKRRGAFAFFVGLALVNSYFFFIGNVVFLFIYFFVKLACKEYTITIKHFSLLAFEALLGVGLGMILALPSFYNLIGNPRTDNFASGFSLIMYGEVQQYFNILSSMFLPPDPPYMPNIFTEGVIKWTSMSFFMPIVGMSGVFAYSKARKGTAPKIIMFICLIMALVPILNSSFYAFNASYYARWYYMPLLIAALMTVHALEDKDIDIRSSSRVVLVITALYAILGLLPEKDEDGVWSIGLADDQMKFWLTVFTAVLGILIFVFIVHSAKNKKKLGAMLLSAVIGFSIFYSIIHIALGKFPQWDNDANYYSEQWVGTAQVSLPSYDDEFYRIDTYEAHDNLGLWLDVSSIRTFNSTINTSIMEFYPLMGVKRDVSSKPELEKYALRGLLSVKYTLMPVEESSEFEAEEGTDGWTYIRTDGPYAIYENDNFVPLGFTYDEYVSMDALSEIRDADRANILMRGIGLDSEQIEEYGHLFEGESVTWEEYQPIGDEEETDDEEDEVNGTYTYDPVTYDRYVENCNERRETAAYQSSASTHGFSVKIDMDEEDLVFFGVPYDEGFTATVNGQDTQVLKVSGGMMAVFAPEGDNEIVFTYKTPGLFVGGIISAICLLILIVYAFVFHKIRKKERLIEAETERAFSIEEANRMLSAKDGVLEVDVKIIQKAFLEKAEEAENDEALEALEELEKAEKLENDEEAVAEKSQEVKQSDEENEDVAEDDDIAIENDKEDTKA